MALFQSCFLRAILILAPISSIFAAPAFSKSTRELAVSGYSLRPKSENWLFSPFSAAACLSMVYSGANNRTASQIANALSFTLPQSEIGPSFDELMQDLSHQSVDESDFKLHIAQGMWSQRDFPFLDRFKADIGRYFHADIESIDFSFDSISKINSWIAAHTDDKIQNLLSNTDIDASTKLVLANAFYFKGCWTKPFLYETSDLFYLQPNETKQIEMLSQAGRFLYFEDDDWQAILLPLSKDRSAVADPACLVLLSKNEMSSSLSSEKLDLILSSMEMRTVNLSIPKFKLEQRADLKTFFEQLGIEDAFTSQSDFSLMDGRQDLFINVLVQKCFFSFEKNGVDAAAATAAVMNITCCKPPAHLLVTFHANHPFEFLLMDMNSQTCLMMGHVADPEL